MHEYQERLVSARTKKFIEHSPAGAYLLNTHALHNYHRIPSVLSPDLRKQLTAAIVTNNDSLRLHAATLLRAAKVAEGEHSAASTSEQPVPAFIKATMTRNGNKKASGMTKAKGKGGGNPSGVVPDYAPVLTSATLSALPIQTPNFTTATSISNHGASSTLPI